ncbi:hypothetical protein HSX10_16265 [Winogradskyella undariae]|uniref:hypothetical protein n=1 Tax=Winogradskyella undariae TaxID=1285465 RepID=UPI00156B4E31|nr:hypothetical protein [Winogradskyella undariae]NRR93132.1 hypothetical protein [Winogradskyella undariae]
MNRLHLHIDLLTLVFCCLFFSCNNTKSTSNDVVLSEKDSLKKELYNEYSLYLWYLLPEEVDSLINNFDKFKDSIDYRKNYILITQNRKKEITILKRNLNTYKQNIPSSFKYYLLPNEVLKFNKDSLSDWIIYNELYKSRRDKISSLVNYSHFLDMDEIQKLIKGEFTDSIYYKELAFSRHQKDSTTNWTAYIKRKDSLQGIVNPIDSILPFGPKALGQLIANNQNEVSFSTNQDLTNDTRNIRARKTIYDTWMYFLKLHPPAGEDLSENYVEKLAPPVSTYEYLNLGIDIESEYQMINPRYVGFQTRISNIGKYEVYYTTTATNYPSECSVHLKKADNCCFGEDYYCESTGYIMLYDRLEQHSVIIPGFVLKSGGQGYLLNTQFFYINDNKIYIYRGSNSWLVNAFTIEILSNGIVVVNEECVLDDAIDKEKYNKDGLNSVSLRFKHNEEEFSTKRDSVFNKIQPLVSTYPFGSPALKELSAFKDNLKLLDSTLKFYQFPGNKERKHSFYTLPITSNLNKINLGYVEYWDKGLLQNLQKSWICSNIEIDSDDINDFKLPEIKNYEVYLSIYNDYGILKGVLILYDPRTHLANIINVLNDYSDGNFRFFNINTNNQIEIYQGYKNEAFEYDNKNKIGISKTHIIKVSLDGKINVIKQ